MTGRKLLFAARVANVYVALMVAVWFGYQVWIGLHAASAAPRPLDCEIIGPTTLVCSPVGP